MNSGTKAKLLSFLGATALIVSHAAWATLSTDQLTRLKNAGLGEDVIRLMVEHDYQDVERVMKLKGAGFSDETIALVVRRDLQGSAGTPATVAQPAETTAPAAAPQAAIDAPALMQTSASVRIEEYFVRGEPIIKNSLDLSKTTVSVLPGNRLKVEWRGNVATSTMDTFLRRKTFASPFYWDLHQGDSLHSVNQKTNAFVLRTGRTHAGEPKADTSRYWIVYITAETPELEKQVRAALAE